MTGKVVLIGARNAGKSTLISNLTGGNMEVKKTQSVEFKGNFIDTPGEFLEIPSLIRGLILSSYDADLVALVQSVDDKTSYYPPNFASIFNKKTIGIVTKCDLGSMEDIKRSEKYLKSAKAEEIFHISNKDQDTIEKVREYINNYLFSK